MLPAHHQRHPRPFFYLDSDTERILLTCNPEGLRSVTWKMRESLRHFIFLLLRDFSSSWGHPNIHLTPAVQKDKARYVYMQKKYEENMTTSRHFLAYAKEFVPIRHVTISQYGHILFFPPKTTKRLNYGQIQLICPRLRLS